MTKKEQQDLVKELDNINTRLKQIVDQVIHTEVETPLIEQVWTYRWLALRGR